jgi:uncharacterized protein YcgI (DUF1989 family)
VGYHDNCTDNLGQALEGIGLKRVSQPAPFNIFMNVPVSANGSTLTYVPAIAAPGDYLELRAEMDCVVAFSACPQDMIPINGEACIVQDAHYLIQS